MKQSIVCNISILIVPTDEIAGEYSHSLHQPLSVQLSS